MHSEIRKRVLARIKPRARPRIARVLRELRRRVAPAEVVLGGSTAKGTHLRGSHDVDVFVRYEEDGPLSERLAAAIPEAERVHGSRDYFHLRRAGYLFEIVPVLKITRPSEAKNVTDVSPLHVAYVTRSLGQRPRLADEIRLAKQFCRAQGIYGAESYLKGLSGHVLDLLIIHYGGFLPLLRAASAWPDTMTIDVAGHHQDPRQAIDGVKHGPLLLVDPIQPARNAAAALSRANYDRFREAARSYLARPALRYFTIQRFTPARARAWHRAIGQGVLLLAEMRPLAGKRDTVATKLRVAHDYLVVQAKRHGFTLIAERWEYDPRRSRAISAIILADERLPEVQRHHGPPLAARRDAERFRAKHPGAQVENGRLVTELPRLWRTPQSWYRVAIRDPYVRERAAAITPQSI